MTVFDRRASACVLSVLTALVLSACGSTSLNRAPVEDRMAHASAAPAPVPPTPAVKQPPGFENAGKPGYYTVKPGDSLIRISLEHGQSMHDVARWSQVENPNRIEVGQVLRVAPPAGGEAVVVKPVSKPTAVASAVGSSAAPASAATAAPPAAVKPEVAEADINFVWPANGTVLAGFDEVKNKGLDIGGVAGSAVLAAADGRVVYVGAGLRGYGNLIILKHNNVFRGASSRQAG